MTNRAHRLLSLPRPSLWQLFTIFLLLGIQSFGGGSATFFLVHQTCIDRGWLDEEEFLRAWSLSQIAPGINLIKLTILVGYHLRGWLGLIAATVGLLLPSSTVTILMTAGFGLIRNQPQVQAAMKGILPATIGLSLAMAANMAGPLISRAGQESRARLGLSLGIMAGSALTLAASGVSPVVVLLGGGLVGVTLFTILPLDRPAEKKEEAG